MSIFSSTAKGETPAPETPRRRRTDGTPLSIVAPDMVILGDLETAGTVKIEGRVRGTVRAGGQVLVSQGALVEGDLFAREAMVAGTVHGAIQADERVELQPTAVVAGDIRTPRIAVLEGARVRGEVRMELPAPEAMDGPQIALEASA